MAEPQTYIVGRQNEVQSFSNLLKGKTNHWILNIYGPGGIGKTVVAGKFKALANTEKTPLAFVDGMRPDLTPDRILYEIKDGFSQTEVLAASFSKFEREYQDYLIVQEVLKRSGGIQVLFDTVGNVKDPVGFAQALGTLGKGIQEELRRNLSNRFALERYLRGVEKALTKSLSESLATAIEKHPSPLALLMDTYEELEGLDDWVCRTLIPALPKGVFVVVLGRNALPKVNFDWGEFGKALHTMELPELTEADTKAYLVHYGLRDTIAQEQIYQFTGGYPLLLVLVRHLANEAGGWDKIGALEGSAERDAIATHLLQRILREERVSEVRTFLEKGVVARWFDPETISALLDVSLQEGRVIYDKLSRHSFVERHPYGLKFHDKIRELLLDRLKFTSQAEYQRLVDRLMKYYAEKAGINPADANPEPANDISE